MNWSSRFYTVRGWTSILQLCYHPMSSVKQSTSAERSSFRFFFIFRNRKKSHWVRSSEYGGRIVFYKHHKIQWSEYILDFTCLQLAGPLVGCSFHRFGKLKSIHWPKFRVIFNTNTPRLNCLNHSETCVWLSAFFLQVIGHKLHTLCLSQAENGNRWEKPHYDQTLTSLLTPIGQLVM